MHDILIEPLKAPLKASQYSAKARHLLFRLLEKHQIDPACFYEDDFGKPFLSVPALYISISHCPQAIACMIADTPCGIDVQPKIDPSEALLKRTLSKALQDKYEAAPDKSLWFTQMWCMKEALYKQDNSQKECFWQIDPYHYTGLAQTLWLANCCLVAVW
jgi:phosphopantetheinyl transferase